MSEVTPSPEPPLHFDGEVALVTGAASGLGLSHARALAERGARVMLNDIATASGEKLSAEDVAAQLRSEGLVADAISDSVGVEAGAEAAVEAAASKWGRIDILVNNAGNGIGGKVQDIETEQLASVLNVHLFGMFWTSRAALRHMRKAGYGRIINTASAVGAFGAPDTAPYVIAKAGVLGLSRATSLDNRDLDIKVNTICPVAETPLAQAYFDKHPELDTSRLTPQAVSPVVVYLSHRRCRLNGEVLSVAGGRVARIFTATAPGMTRDGLTAETVEENLAAILSEDGYSIPTSSIDQYALQPKGR
ncbi:SDR family NAD(P)-dependent oxidoreductase [Henriciella sp. AS95]|uniref:SDR family NAD(P)-dependent oxidoreductase n=1 Tax=Henriciella sp. AS95 TaxID=3135782 RepID=UPI00317A0A8C